MKYAVKKIKPSVLLYVSAGKRIFVTGKNWSKLFEIEIIGK